MKTARVTRTTRTRKAFSFSCISYLFALNSCKEQAIFSLFVELRICFEVMVYEMSRNSHQFSRCRCLVFSNMKIHSGYMSIIALCGNYLIMTDTKSLIANKFEGENKYRFGSRTEQRGLVFFQQHFLLPKKWRGFAREIDFFARPRKVKSCFDYFFISRRCLRS